MNAAGHAGAQEPQRDDLFEQAVKAAVGGDTEDALESLMQLLSKTPNDIQALVLKGNVFEMRSWIPQARAVYERVLALDPGNSDGLIGLGDCARAVDDFPAALGYFNDARERLEAGLGPSHGEEAMELILEGQYSCLMELGREAEAGQIVAYGQAVLPESETVAILARAWEKRRKQ